MTDAQYARKLAKEYGIIDPEEIAAIERTMRADVERNDALKAMHDEGRGL